MINKKNTKKKQLLVNLWKEDFKTNVKTAMRLKIYCEFQHIIDHLSEVDSIASKEIKRNDTTQTHVFSKKQEH